MRICGIGEKHLLLSFSPVRETLRSAEVLLQPSYHAEQMPWTRAARRRLRRRLKTELEHFRFLFTPSPELFPTLCEDFRGPDATTEIDVLLRNEQAYIEAVVRRLSGASLLEKSELSAMCKRRWYREAALEHASRDPKARAMLDEFVASPARSLKRFCAVLLAMYAEVVQPVWGAVASGLSRDIEMRQRVLRKYGLMALLRTLSAELSVHHGNEGTAEVDLGEPRSRVDLGKRGRLELSPSFFCWPHLQAYVLKRPSGLHCAIAYPIPPLPARVAPVPDRRRLASSASALGNDLRLRIIELLQGRDLSTRELSGFLHELAPVVSRHLRVLLDAALVERYRSGYFVMYRLRVEALATIARRIGDLAGS